MDMNFLNSLRDVGKLAYPLLLSWAEVELPKAVTVGGQNKEVFCCLENTKITGYTGRITLVHPQCRDGGHILKTKDPFKGTETR